MRGNPGSGSRGMRSVAEDRAKILQLIATLAAKRQADAAGRRTSSSARPEREHHRPLPVRELARPSRTDPLFEPQGAPSTARREQAELTKQLPRHAEPSAYGQGAEARIQNLELRVARLEERLATRVSRAPVAAVDAQPAPTFSGIIQGQMLSDMLQLVSSNGLSGVFVVEDEQTKSVLYFDQGAICHAEAPGMTGEMAFFTAFGIQEGRYAFRETSDLPSEKTVTGSTQFLILEALRQIDETGNDG